ncbi:MAG: site-2 protease family protein [Deltaproteobacteria bacterium]|nr:site-2 protease family protein [Deltaproteobacteria bacterium]
MDIQPNDVLLITRGLIVLIMSIAVHEFGHAWVADRLGDDLPSRQGRVTLNPVAHADPIGTLILPLASMLWAAMQHQFIGAGIGWGKPVQTQPRNYTRKIRMATGSVLVAIAGPLMNVLFATFLVLLHAILIKTGTLTLGGRVSEALFFAVGLNFMLFFFNLLPIPPLDGGYVLDYFAPYSWRSFLDTYKTYSIFLLMLVIATPLGAVIFVPAEFVSHHLYVGVFTLFGLT